MSKILQPVPAHGVNSAGDEQAYGRAMARVRDGLSNDVWGKGSLAEKRAFAEDFFAARVSGGRLREQGGHERALPDLSEENGCLVWSGGSFAQRDSRIRAAGVELSRGDMASHLFGVEDGEAEKGRDDADLSAGL